MQTTDRQSTGRFIHRPLVGVVDFIDSTTGRTMTTVPLYEGESLEGFEVLFRAQRHLALESKPVGALGSNVFCEHHAYNAGRKLVKFHD